MIISGMNKVLLIPAALAPPLVQNELNPVNSTFDTDDIPSRNDIADGNNNGITDNTNTCSDVIDADNHNKAKDSYFGTVDKTYYSDDTLPFDSEDSNSVSSKQYGLFQAPWEVDVYLHRNNNIKDDTNTGGAKYDMYSNCDHVNMKIATTNKKSYKYKNKNKNDDTNTISKCIDGSNINTSFPTIAKHTKYIRNSDIDHNNVAPNNARNISNGEFPTFQPLYKVATTINNDNNDMIITSTSPLSTMINGGFKVFWPVNQDDNGNTRQ